MINPDDKFLEELGLGSLPASDKKALLNQIYGTLETRVGMRLTGDMNDAQLDEFEAFINNKRDEDDVLQWLKANFPDYEKVVADELEKLKAEIKAAAPQLLADAGGTSGQPSTQDLFKQLGLEKLSNDEKLNLSDDLGGVVLDRVAARLEAILTPEQALEFETKLQTDEKGAFELLAKFVPDYTSIVKEEVELLRNDIVGTQAEVMKKLGF